MLTRLWFSERVSSETSVQYRFFAHTLKLCHYDTSMAHTPCLPSYQLVAIFTQVQALRVIHYSLTSRTWLVIKLGHVKQSHTAVFTDSGGIFSCM